MKKRVTKDFETRSACDLKSAGAYKYSLDPSTQPTCLAFKISGSPKIYFLNFKLVNTPWPKLPLTLRILWKGLISDGYEFSAHNSFFERCIYDNILVKRYGWPVIDPRQRRCTAAKAAACALPRSLEGAGDALKLSTQKDKRGYVAMMATCKPTKEWKKWNESLPKKTEEPVKFLEESEAQEIWNTLYTYCKIDVKTEELLDDTLPDLIPQEQEIWYLNQELNWRGLPVDIPTVRKIVGIMEIESRTKLKELDNLTMGLVRKPGARKSILEFLAMDGIELPDIKAQTVDDALKGGKLSPTMKALLELRKALSKTSTKKYEAFLKRANSDNRVRDILMYHGASTGRDAGTGIQPHNFPRGTMRVDKNRPYAAVENVIECDHDMLKILYGDNLAILFSSILRNMIIPSTGKELFVADFSKIEVAVLWWLSGNTAGLEILNKGLDPYIYMAAANTGKTYEEIEHAIKLGEDWALDARQLGKAQVLGCGFGMGWKRFQQTAWDVYRLKLTDEQSQAAVKTYRTFNEAVPRLWQEYEAAAIASLEIGNIQTAGKCAFHWHKKFVWVMLPSSRKLAYRDPQVSWRMREVDVEDVHPETGEKVTRKEMRGPYKTFEYWAVNSKTKKWSLERTFGGKLTENIVQAVARDLIMPALLRLEKAGYLSLLMVHDESISEKKIGTGSIDEFVKILCERPRWATGLPLEAKGWKGPRYRK